MKISSLSSRLFCLWYMKPGFLWTMPVEKLILALYFSFSCLIFPKRIHQLVGQWMKLMVFFTYCLNFVSLWIHLDSLLFLVARVFPDKAKSSDSFMPQSLHVFPLGQPCTSCFLSDGWLQLFFVFILSASYFSQVNHPILPLIVQSCVNETQWPQNTAILCLP